MSIDSVTGTASTAPTNNTSSGSASDGQSIDQADFLSLLVTQMQNQDPTSPMDSSQMVSQLAQISQVQATQNLQTSLSSLVSQIQSSQVADSSGLIGKTATVPSSAATLSDGSLTGAVNVATSNAPVSVQITDPNSGKVVRTIDLGTPDSGLTSFTWDGKADDGSQLADGTYQISATAGQTAAQTYVTGTVSGVGSAGSDNGTYLQVDGVGGVLLSQVAQVN